MQVSAVAVIKCRATYTLTFLHTEISLGKADTGILRGKWLAR
jgi:hypothetical protein